MKQFIKDFKKLDLYDKLTLIIGSPAAVGMLLDYFYFNYLVQGV
tara:strand:+ start:713 stop:844 length:132 start_codon:yes stop_codon:yes gene_type:complete